MSKLLLLFAASVILAYLSEQHTRAVLASGRRYSVWNDGAYLLLVVILTLFAGLRTSYNDTGNYMSAFKSVPVLSDFLATPDNLNPFKNPLFNAYQSFLKTCGFDSQMLIFLSAFFTQACFVRFIKRYASQFTFSIFLYFTLGTFVLTLAAIKQVLGMALAALAFPYLEKKQWAKYYFFVFLAMLTHTYALAFAFLPLFRVKPWGIFTFLFMTVVVAVMMNFEETITAFMDQANDLGKSLADFEVFSDTTINIFRLAVYAVPPLISIVFRKWVLHDTNRMENTLIHMSIISLAFMIMGTQAGANMFGRMGNYFELGTLCCLPTMLKKTFDNKSYGLISVVACICFLGFFVYANALGGHFDSEYNAIGLIDLILSFRR